jgi:hypothetical protein
MSTVKKLFAVALMLGTAGPAFAGSYTLPLDARIVFRPIDAIDEIVPNVANPSLGGNIAQR